MKAFYISIFLSLISFFLVINNQEKRAILIMIFMIPFYSFYPIENSIIHTNIHVEISGIIMISIWIAMKLKRRKNNWKELSPSINSLYYFLIIGIFLGSIYYNDGVEHLGMSICTPSDQIIEASIFIILVILLLKILVNYQYDDVFKAKIAKIFILTIFIQVLSQLLRIFGYEYILWGLFYSRGLFDIIDIRNIGLYTGFGMGVYIVLIISLSVLYFNRHNKISSLAILFAIIYSLLSGQRQTIAFIILFIILLTFIYIVKLKLSMKYFSIIIILIIFISVLWSNYISKSVSIQRFNISFAYINNDEILRASGRDVLGIPSVLADIKTYPIWGKGLLMLGVTKNSNTNIAGHVIWFNIYKKFGIIGLIYLLTIIIYPITKLYKIIMKTNDRYVIKEGAILFSLMVTVFAQQFFDNFFWWSNTMLLYAFIYFWVFSFINRQKLGNKRKKFISYNIPSY
jgi:hypothetical protein